MTSPPRLFLKVAEVAEVLRMDVRTVRRGIDEGTIPAVRIGTAIRIPVPKFTALFQLNEEAVAVPPATAPDQVPTTATKAIVDIRRIPRDPAAA